MNDTIKQNVLKLQNANATPADIEAYVKSAVSEQGGQAPQTDTVPTDNRNIIQKIGGAVYDPLVTMAARPGQLAGVGIAGLASKISGDPQYYEKAKATMNQPSQVPLLGTNIKPVNQETPESVGGEALGTVGLGVGSPVVGGALLGASSAMQDNGSPASVAVNAVVGSLLGKGGEVVLKAAIPVISKIISKYGSEAISQFEKSLPEYAKPTLNKIVSTIETKTGTTIAPSSVRLENAINDATPSYSPKIIGEQPVAEGGLVKGRKSISTPANIESGTELANVPGYDHANTNLINYQAVQKEIPLQAQTLSSSLKAEGVLRPPKEIMSVVKKAVTNASQNSLLLQKTDPIVTNYLRVAERAINQSDGTLEGEWNVRKILDQAYDDAGGKYGNNKGLDQIHRASRNALLKDMEKKARNTEVTAAMKKMTNLYNASDVLQDNAKAEGGSALERLMKKHPVIMRFVPRILEGAGLGGVQHLIP